MKVVTSDEMRVGELWAVRHGTTIESLMDRAGLAVANEAARMSKGKQVVVLVGPGNNGGDGLIAGSVLAKRGFRVSIGLLPRRGNDDRPLATARGCPMSWFDLADPDSSVSFGDAVTRADVVVDALLGTGKGRPLTGPAAAALALLALRPATTPLIAVDLPSGLDADSGRVDPLTPTAELSVTFAAPKRGLYLLPGSQRAGRIVVADIGIDSDAFESVRHELIDDSLLRALVPGRPIHGHKGTFGKVLVVAGSERYVGAAYLAASAAGRSGAGLVTLATGHAVYRRLAGRLVEATYLPLPEEPIGHIAERAVDEVLAACDGYDSLVVGPGIGRSPSSDAFLRKLLPHVGLPTVIDADALNVLSATESWWDLLPKESILTPHSGEMARLQQKTIPAVEADRFSAVIEGAAKWRATVLLKGSNTLIADPEGRVRISPYANPALASAGTGDVLSGAIGSLLAQGLSVSDAAALGVALHALAAGNWSDINGNAGMLASDLLIEIPRVRRRFAKQPITGA